jgi:hypothetical protein
MIPPPVLCDVVLRLAATDKFRNLIGLWQTDEIAGDTLG